MKMFDADKTRMIALPYGVKTMTICWAVFIHTGTLQTDRRTDGRMVRIATWISRVSTLTHIKNWIFYFNNTFSVFIFILLISMHWHTRNTQAAEFNSNRKHDVRFRLQESLTEQIFTKYDSAATAAFCQT